MHNVDGGKTVRVILKDCNTLHNGSLTDVEFNEWVLKRLCEFLGMTPVGTAFSQQIPPGLSCGLVIAESHIFIHTWPESASVRVVIDSCVDFDHDAASEWLKEIYEAGAYTYHRTQ